VVALEDPSSKTGWDAAELDSLEAIWGVELREGAD
jgi:hypothetical protein